MAFPEPYHYHGLAESCRPGACPGQDDADHPPDAHMVITAGDAREHAVVGRAAGAVAWRLPTAGFFFSAVLLAVVFFGGVQRPPRLTPVGEERIALVSDGKRRFRKIVSGSCTSNGLQPIMDPFECEAAALQLQLLDSVADETSNIDRPEGCYYYIEMQIKKETLWLNHNPLSAGKGTDMGNRATGSLREPICRVPPGAPDAVAPIFGAGGSWLPRPAPGAAPGSPCAVKKLSGGTCLGSSLHPIVSQDLCQTAAHKLGLPGNTVDVFMDSANEPMGCYYNRQPVPGRASLWLDIPSLGISESDIDHPEHFFQAICSCGPTDELRILTTTQAAPTTPATPPTTPPTTPLAIPTAMATTGATTLPTTATETVTTTTSTTTTTITTIPATVITTTATATATTTSTTMTTSTTTGTITTTSVTTPTAAMAPVTTPSVAPATTTAATTAAATTAAATTAAATTAAATTAAGTTAETTTGQGVPMRYDICQKRMRPADPAAGEPGCPGSVQVRGTAPMQLVGAKFAPNLTALCNDVVVQRLGGRAYFGDTCSAGQYSNTGYAALRLLGKTIRYTTDISGAGCGCNAALYLTSLRQNDNKSTCGDHYCDANKICGVRCAEIDLQEANERAWVSTLHLPDDPAGAGDGYSAYHQKWTPQQYGPGAACIDTTAPFDVAVSFPVDKQGTLVAMEVTLTQAGHNCPLSARIGAYTFGTRDGMRELTLALADGMTPIVSYWNSRKMGWLDGKGPSGLGPCAVDHPRQCGDAVRFYDFSLEDCT